MTLVLPCAHPAWPEGDGDSRFTLGPVLDVEAVLVKHGYPPITSQRDLLKSRSALFGFIYGDTTKGGTQE
ncbi:hypothetical protein [Streptomyces sp. NPDC051776]|uniref:hypothetical protein n=1 Tax=Streptomyces sp. NPDC051776 TaxID=3155414 RepID=UPI00342CD1ED